MIKETRVLDFKRPKRPPTKTRRIYFDCQDPNEVPVDSPRQRDLQTMFGGSQGPWVVLLESNTEIAGPGVGGECIGVVKLGLKVALRGRRGLESWGKMQFRPTDQGLSTGAIGGPIGSDGMKMVPGGGWGICKQVNEQGK